MASPRANPTLIGAFVVGAFALAATAVIVFGSGRILQDRTRLVTFFPDPVTGLDEGAPVIFYGVQVGQVEKIDAMIDFETYSILGRVYFEVDEARVVRVDDPEMSTTDAIQSFVAEGLRAQLKSQSLITGKLYIDLDRHPDSKIMLHGLDPHTLEIPNIPTSMQALERELREFAERIKELPLEEIVKDLSASLKGLNELISEGEAEEAIRRLNASLKRAESVLGRIDARAEGLMDEVEGSVREIRAAAGAAESSMAALEATIEPGSTLHQQMLDTLLELQATLRSLRTLSDQVAEQPEQVIFGRPKEAE